MITSEVVLVTPEMAETWLGRALPNRTVSRNRVKAYAADMEGGRWVLTNQGIGFTADYRLTDGQHRLLAVISSMATVPMLVIRGLPAESQDHVDELRARSLSDRLAIKGVSGAKDLVARARIIHLIRSGPVVANSVLLSSEQLMDVVREWDEHLRWSLTAFPSRLGGIAPASIVGGWIYARAATREVDDWVGDYCKGTYLTENDPLLVLRDAFNKVETGYSAAGRFHRYTKTLRALWARHTNQPLKKLYASIEGVVGFARLMGDQPTVELWKNHSTKPWVRERVYLAETESV
jgi:hypothetical protein